MLTSCFEQRECAVSVDGKVGDGITRGPIMRWLCRCMNYDDNMAAKAAE